MSAGSGSTVVSATYVVDGRIDLIDADEHLEPRACSELAAVLVGRPALGFKGRAPRPAPATPSAVICFTICWYTSENEALRCQRHRVRSAWTMHSGFIGSVHTLSPWTPPGLNNGAVSARPAPTWPLVAHHPQLNDSLSILDQHKRRRRMETVGSDRASAGAGPSLPRAFSSLPW
jgi:hypothetical protein